MPTGPETISKNHTFKPNVVEIVGEEYIDKTFKPNAPEDLDLINNTIQDFLLNEE